MPLFPYFDNPSRHPPKNLVVYVDGPILNLIEFQREFRVMNPDVIFEKMFECGEDEWSIFKETLKFHLRGIGFDGNDLIATDRWDHIRKEIADIIQMRADVFFQENYRFKKWLTHYVAVFEIYHEPKSIWNNHSGPKLRRY